MTTIADLLVVRDGVGAGIVPPTGGQPSRGFGGHVAALALVAAYQTVADGLSIHHLHVEFLRPARIGEPVTLDVRRFEDGRTIARRQVDVSQAGEPPLATMVCTFNLRRSDGPDFQIPMPVVPRPEAVPVTRTDPVEVRRHGDSEDPARQVVWMRPAGRPIDAEQSLHDGVLLFMADYMILWPTLRVHGFDPEANRHVALGTVANTMWFHRAARADQWFLYDQRTPSTSTGLGHGEGRIFTRDGGLVASATQVGLLRPNLVPTA
jgi:acyl-CoA thioesterase-2